jgi:hypothetical protein
MFATCWSQPAPTAPEWPPSLSDLVKSAPTVPFCKLVSHPANYQRKVVRTLAVFYGDRENEVLYDPQCPNEANFTWVDFDPSYVYTDEFLKRRLKETLGRQPPYVDGKAQVTAVGRFEAANGGGYGHLDSYRFRFSIMRIEAVDAVETSKDD